jgi:catechol 2,3-dioxygenase-like lactoylglutathione lyase family enzyme
MKFHHISITVKNLKDSINFYKDVFNFELISEFSKEETNSKFAYMKFHNLIIELWEFKNPSTPKNELSDLKVIGYGHIAFSSKSIEKEVTRLNNLGLNFSKAQLGASGKKYSLGSDINNISIEIIEE